MKKFLSISAILFVLSAILYAQQRATPNQLRVITDSTGALLAASSAQTLPLSQPTVFSNTRLRTDASGNLVVVLSGGAGGVTSITGTANQVIASASTGAVTLSTPQDIGTSSNVTFASWTTSAADTANRAAIAATSTVGILLQNATAATGGATVQMSPRLGFLGHVWNTTTDTTSQFIIENLPATAATPTAQLRFGYSANGGAFTFPGILTNVGQYLSLDGTSSLPTYSFASETTLGLWRSSSNTITLQGNLSVTQALTAGGNISLGSTSALLWGNGTNIISTTSGNISFRNNGNTIGSQFKTDALPTLASGGGGTIAAAVTAGSTPLAGSINVGTGVITSPIVINFNGTAFPSAPFCISNDGQTAIAVRATSSTTQLTLTSAAFVASDIISWICISSK